MKFNLKSTGDQITFFPWHFLFNLKTKLLGGRHRLPTFTSHNYGFSFTKMSEYWIEVGKKNALIGIVADQAADKARGFSIEETLVKAGLHEFGPLGVGIILYNIDLQYVGRLQGSLPSSKLNPLKEDVVFIACHGRDQALTLLRKISLGVANAICVDRGILAGTNQ